MENNTDASANMNQEAEVWKVFRRLLHDECTRFIKLVEERPVLWKKSMGPRSHELKEREWTGLCIEFHSEFVGHPVALTKEIVQRTRKYFLYLKNRFDIHRNGSVTDADKTPLYLKELSFLESESPCKRKNPCTDIVMYDSKRPTLSADVQPDATDVVMEPQSSKYSTKTVQVDDDLQDSRIWFLDVIYPHLRRLDSASLLKFKTDTEDRLKEMLNTDSQIPESPAPENDGPLDDEFQYDDNSAFLTSSFSKNCNGTHF